MRERVREREGLWYRRILTIVRIGHLLSNYIYIYFFFFSPYSNKRSCIARSPCAFFFLNFFEISALHAPEAMGGAIGIMSAEITAR